MCDDDHENLCEQDSCAKNLVVVDKPKLRIFEYESIVEAALVTTEIQAFVSYMIRVSNDLENASNKTSTERIKLQTLFYRDRSYLEENFPAISKLITICLLLALSNARVEGSYSTMNSIHTASRNALSVKTVNALMFVKSYSCSFSELRATPKAKKIKSGNSLIEM